MIDVVGVGSGDVGIEMPEQGIPLEIGKGRILKEGTRVALFSYGTRLAEALKAAENLEQMGISTTVATTRPQRFC